MENTLTSYEETLKENPSIAKAMSIRKSMDICTKLLDDEEDSTERLELFERYHRLSEGYYTVLATCITESTQKFDDICKERENIINTLASKRDELLKANAQLAEKIKNDNIEFDNFIMELALDASMSPEIVVNSLAELVNGATEVKPKKNKNKSNLKLIKGNLN